MNYSVKKNVFLVPRLSNVLTLRLGKEKVVIIKKKTSKAKLKKIEKEVDEGGEDGRGK